MKLLYYQLDQVGKNARKNASNLRGNVQIRCIKEENPRYNKMNTGDFTRRVSIQIIDLHQKRTCHEGAAPVRSLEIGELIPQSP